MIQPKQDLAVKELQAKVPSGILLLGGGRSPRRRASFGRKKTSDRHAAGGSCGHSVRARTKRSRSGSDAEASVSRSQSSDPFDMGEFLEVSRRIEDTIAFPTIEWPSCFDEDDGCSSSDSFGHNSASEASSTFTFSGDKEEEEEDEDREMCGFEPTRRKRQCRRLTRCVKSYAHLPALWNMSQSST